MTAPLPLIARPTSCPYCLHGVQTNEWGDTALCDNCDGHGDRYVITDERAFSQSEMEQMRDGYEQIISDLRCKCDRVLAAAQAFTEAALCNAPDVPIPWGDPVVTEFVQTAMDATEGANT